MVLKVLVDEFLETEERLVVDKESVDDVNLVAQAAEEVVVLTHGIYELLARLGRGHIVVSELFGGNHREVVFQRCIEIVEHLVETLHADTARIVAHLHKGTATGDLLGFLAFHDDRESVDIVLLAIDAFEDGLRDEVEVAVGAHDVEHLRAGAAEHDGAWLGQSALLHHRCHIID